MHQRIHLFLWLFILMFSSCSSPDVSGADKDAQVSLVTLEELLDSINRSERYVVILMPTWCSGSKWLAQEKIPPLADSLRFHRISYFFVVLSSGYEAAARFAKKNGLKEPYYLIRDEWQGNGWADRLLINKLSKRLKVSRKDNSVPFGFFVDRKNRKISHYPYDYKYLYSRMEQYDL